MDDKRLHYLPGLDGLRALAVTAVLLYHAGLSWIPGGFLGVEVFFVISGYLITCVLLADRERTGRFDLRQFWFRRARRLLPALFVLLLVTLAVAVPFYRGEVAELRVDLLAALGYSTNWYFILDHQSYFEFAGRPPLLQHLWSLAIEEQFYLVWPLVLALLVGRLRRGGMFVLLIGGAVASSVLMAALWRPDADPSRVYYGTDTRAAGLLVGAALALVWAPWALPRRRHRAYPVLLNLAGLGALALLVLLHLELDQYQPLLYRGGFALVALSTALIIAVAVHPQAHAGKLLGMPPLRWLGTRSYAVYLWHWPVFMLTRPQVDVSLDGGELLALRLGITCALAELTYRLVEKPVRLGALGRAWRAYRHSRGIQRWARGARWGAPVGVTALCGAVLAVFAVSAQPPAPPSYLSVKAVHIVSQAGAVDAADRVTRATRAPAPIPPTSTPDPASGTGGPAQPRQPNAGPIPAAVYVPVGGVTVTALGDSVMVGAAAELAAAIGGAEIDAVIGRQTQDVVRILQQRGASGGLGEAVVIHVGNNGVFTAGQFDAMMQSLSDRRVVVFVSVRVPRNWEGPNNSVIANGVARYSNAALVDWHSASVNRPDLFWEDGIHLRSSGVQLYTSLITQELAAHTPPPPPAPADTPAPTPVPTDTPAPPPPPTAAPTPAPTSSPPPAVTPTPSGTPLPTPPP